MDGQIIGITTDAAQRSVLILCRPLDGYAILREAKGIAVNSDQSPPGNDAPQIPSINEIIEYGKTHTAEEMEQFWLERV